MIGDEVTKYRSILELSYPTTEGIVKNWEDMELLLDYSFKSVHNTPNSAGPDLNERQIPHDDLSRHEPGRQSRQDGLNHVLKIPGRPLPARPPSPHVLIRLSPRHRFTA
jgi:hypothetical protein